jgi:hypothetical protein
MTATSLDARFAAIDKIRQTCAAEREAADRKAEAALASLLTGIDPPPAKPVKTVQRRNSVSRPPPVTTAPNGGIGVPDGRVLGGASPVVS